MNTPTLIAIYVMAVNLLAFVAFGTDKRLAINGAWRISENTLLWLALIGGSAGAVTGQRLFHHKTRKEPFRTTLYGIVLLQIVALGMWIFKPDLVAALFR